MGCVRHHQLSLLQQHELRLERRTDCGGSILRCFSFLALRQVGSGFFCVICNVISIGCTVFPQTSSFVGKAARNGLSALQANILRRNIIAQSADFTLPDGKNFWLRHVCGVVVDQQRWSETHVSGGGGFMSINNGQGMGYSAPMQSAVVNKQDIWVQKDDGLVESFSVAGGVATGHKVSIFWGGLEGVKKGPYRGVFNYASDSMAVIDMGITNGITDSRLDEPSVNLFDWILSLVVSGLAASPFVLFGFRVWADVFGDGNGVTVGSVIGGVICGIVPFLYVLKIMNAKQKRYIENERDGRALLRQKMQALVDQEKAVPTVFKQADATSAPLDQSANTPVQQFCTACGTAAALQAAFCGKCGMSMRTA